MLDLGKGPWPLLTLFGGRLRHDSAVSELVKLWRADLAKTNRKAAAALADPAEYPNLFEEDFELVRRDTARDRRTGQKRTRPQPRHKAFRGTTCPASRVPSPVL